MFKINPAKKIIIIFTFALLIRLVYVLFFVPKNFENLYPDSNTFNTIALNIIENKEFSLIKGKPLAQDPFYPFFLSIIYFIFGHSHIIVLIIQCILSALTCILIYEIAKKIFNEKVSLFSSFFASIYPFFIYYNAAILRETLLVFLLCLSIYLLIYAKENKKIAFLSGLSLGILCLTKSINIVFTFLTIILFLFFTLKENNYSLKINKTYFIWLILLGFSISYTPWLYRNYKIFNKFIISTGGGINLYQPLIVPYEIAGTPQENEFIEKDPVVIESKKMNEIERDAFFYKKAKELIKKEPKNFIRRFFIKFFKLWRLYPHRAKTYAHSDNLLMIVSLLSYGLLLPFFIYGAIISLKNLSNTFLLYLPLISYSLIYSIYWSQIRYRLPLEPIVIIFASYGIDYIMNSFNFYRRFVK